MRLLGPVQASLQLESDAIAALQPQCARLIGEEETFVGAARLQQQCLLATQTLLPARRASLERRRLEAEITALEVRAGEAEQARPLLSLSLLRRPARAVRASTRAPFWVCRRTAPPWRRCETRPTTRRRFPRATAPPPLTPPCWHSPLRLKLRGASRASLTFFGASRPPSA